MINTPFVATALALLEIPARMAKKILSYLACRTAPAAPNDSSGGKICRLVDEQRCLQIAAGPRDPGRLSFQLFRIRGKPLAIGGDLPADRFGGRSSQPLPAGSLLCKPSLSKKARPPRV
jgi:hypothetical protein